jgi:hypothetical protein
MVPSLSGWRAINPTHTNQYFPGLTQTSLRDEDLYIEREKNISPQFVTPTLYVLKRRNCHTRWRLKKNHFKLNYAGALFILSASVR